MKYLFIAILFAFSCKKKEEVKPNNTVTIECYCQNSNSTLISDVTEKITTQRFTKSYEVTDPEKVIYLSNNNCDARDSIWIKVNYHDKTKEVGVRCVGVIARVGFQLTKF